MSIFFNKQQNNKFFDVEAFIYEDGQFITAKDAYLEIENRNYNMIFSYLSQLSEYIGLSNNNQNLPR